MPLTRTVTVNSTDASSIAVQTYPRIVSIGEDPSISGYPTTDFLVYKMTTDENPRRIPAGGNYTFPRTDAGSFRPGQIVGYVKAVTGSTTFFIDESD